MRILPTSNVQRLRLLPSLMVSAILIASLAGCAHRQEASGGAAQEIFKVAMTAEPTTFDPDLVQDGTTIDLLQQIYEGLVQWTPQNTLAPALAKSWDISKNGRTYTFHLRPNVHFHSGEPLTADDVAYSFQRSLDPKLASPVALTYNGDIVGAQAFAAGKAKSLAGVKVIDPLTVQITIAKPKAYWLNILTYPTAYVLNPKAVAKDPHGSISENNTDGTGPFSLTRYVKDNAVDLAAFGGYWGGRPNIDGQHRPILTDAGTRHDQYVAGALDLVDETAGSLQADMNDPSLKDQVKFFKRAATFYIGLNQKAYAPFKDVRVRQALAYATDKQRIISVVFNNHRDLAQDILPEGVPGYDSSFKGIPYDPAKAKQLLADAGYAGGKGLSPLPMYYRESYPDLDKTVDLLRQMYQATLGITVIPRVTEWTSLLNLEDKNALPSYHIRWAADYLDPQDYYSILLRTGSLEDHTGYSNPVYDQLCDRADVCQNPDQRLAMYRQAAKIVANEVPYIPLYYQQDVELIKPDVGGLDDCLMGHLPYKHLTLGAGQH